MKITHLIIIATVLVFVLQAVGVIGIDLAFMPAAAFSKPYTIITSMFMHGGIQHLLLNMLGLFVFGSIVEHELGWKRWLMLYFAAGFIGSLGYMLFSSSSFIPALGASGAIFGLMGAAAILKPRQIIYTQFGPIPMLGAAIVWGIMEVIYSFGVDNIAHSAHLGGLVGGAIFAYSYRKELKTYFYLVFTAVPIVIIILIASGMSNGLRTAHPIITDCILNESHESANLNYYYYLCEKGSVFSLTKPAVGRINPAYYDEYFSGIIESIGGCVPELSIDISENIVTASGTVCEMRFLAVAQDCGKERFELVQIYETNPHLSDVNCDLLS